MTPMPTASPMRQVVNRITSWAVDGVYLLTVVCVLALAVRVVASIVRILWHAPSYAAILAVLDPLLFLLMLAELLHTIALALQTHHLPLRPLLALVLMAVLRHGVVLASTSALDTWNAGATLFGLFALSGLLARISAHDAD